jgi:hypothetical protein
MRLRHGIQRLREHGNQEDGALSDFLMGDDCRATPPSISRIVKRDGSSIHLPSATRPP